MKLHECARVSEMCVSTRHADALIAAVYIRQLNPESHNEATRRRVRE